MMTSSNDNKLFMVYLGGSATGANIELHDIRFVSGSTIEDTYTTLQQQWFGDKSKVHMDSYVQLHHADGYRIELKSEAPSTERQFKGQLYFVNFGAYFDDKLAEFHDFTLVVADSPQAAKTRAKEQIKQGALKDASLLHKDDLLAVDDCLLLERLDGLYIHLQHDGQQQALTPDWKGYFPFSKE